MPLRRVVLHVGTPKSGTTYLQELLHASAGPLAAAGVLVPGTPEDHFRAALDLSYGSFHDHVDPALPGAWGRLVDAARAHEGTTVISHELLGDLSAEAAARVLTDLAPAEVDVVVTARDLARQVPAVWQEDVKNRHFLPFADLLAVLRPGGDADDVPRPGPACTEGHADTFWLRQDLPALLARWGAGRAGARVHLVTVPPAGAPPAELWRRFAAVLGVSPGIAVLPASPANASLGRVATELLRRVNAELGYRVPWQRYNPRVPDLVRAAPLPAGATAAPLVLPPAERPWVAAQADAQIRAVARLGPWVVGDLEDLRVPAAVPSSPLPPAGDLEPLLDEALAWLRPRLPVPAGAPGDEALVPRPRAEQHPATAPVTGPSVARAARAGARGTLRSWRPWSRPGSAAPLQAAR